MSNVFRVFLWKENIRIKCLVDVCNAKWNNYNKKKL